MDHKELHDMIDEMLGFCNLTPTEPMDGNISTAWFTDKTTGKQFYIAIGECEE